MFNFGVCLLEAVYELATLIYAERVAEEPYESHSDIGDIADEAWDLLEGLYERAKIG